MSNNGFKWKIKQKTKWNNEIKIPPPQAGTPFKKGENLKTIISSFLNKVAEIRKILYTTTAHANTWINQNS